MKSFTQEAPYDKEHEHDSLRDGEGRFGAVGNMQSRDLQERLDHEHEDIEVERYDGTNDVDPARGSGQVAGIACRNRRR